MNTSIVASATLYIPTQTRDSSPICQWPVSSCIFLLVIPHLLLGKPLNFGTFPLEMKSITHIVCNISLKDNIKVVHTLSIANTYLLAFTYTTATLVQFSKLFSTEMSLNLLSGYVQFVSLLGHIKTKVYKDHKLIKQ